MSTMNEHLVERFGRSTRGVRAESRQVEIVIQPEQLNHKIRQYFEEPRAAVDGGPWLSCHEIPTSAEVLLRDPVDSNLPGAVDIVPNKPVGPWESNETYLSAHYGLLREDAVRPLREAVSTVRANPKLSEDAFRGTIGIYEKVHICAVTCSTRGIALRVTFSLHRAGKKILWEQSKRLISGSLVVLTPVDDMFKSRAIVATVAARPLAGLQQNPPEVDLFVGRAEELEVDPAKEFVMIEERAGFYEADRHTLLALQKMMREPFPLSDHLIHAKTTISPPQYVRDGKKLDLTSVLHNSKHKTYENIDVVRDWPAEPSSDLDASQLSALHRIITKRLAIIQGPPGTGKTFVSVEAIKVMLANRKPKDPPIIVACQTNHAVDQLLRHVAVFEEDFARLGGRSKDKDIIKPRTLFELRKLAESQAPLAGSLFGNSRKKMKDLEKEIALLLSPLKPTKAPMDFRILEKVGIITAKQANSLEAGASEWVQDELSNPNEARTSPFKTWLGDKLVAVPPKQLPEEFGFDFEEADLAFEQLRELEAENSAKDDEEFETLSGLTLPIADNFTCRKVPGVPEDKLEAALSQQDMWRIPKALRGPVYRHLQMELKKHILTSLRQKTKTYNRCSADRRTGQWEKDETILKKQKIIGMTTTGLSKYRGLISALQPRTVLIEEAAETLEAPVAVACMSSLEHLILVGDHKQLRPHTHVKELEDEPYFYNISLFERMVNNEVEYDTLSKQRRMIPEIRRILRPVYGNLIKDHASVLDVTKRPPVPGMGGVNSFFFTHRWPEQRDEQKSAYNPDEADMIVGFVEYLFYNGVSTRDVTVLTFYNGQRKRILSELRQKVSLSGNQFNVVTVDSYQGEENKIVLLSLVRSNDRGQIGFLEVDNRVCVALSRAQCGLYIFGNGELLYGHNKQKSNTPQTWLNVIEIMAARGSKQERPTIKPKRIATTLPLKCSNHDEETTIESSADWEHIHGGCQQKCAEKLPCGHLCEYSCHPFGHDQVPCRQRCAKKLICGHGHCENACGEVCNCKKCSKPRAAAQIVASEQQYHSHDGRERLSHASSSSGSWNVFAREAQAQYAVAASAPASSKSSSPQKPTDVPKLLEVGAADELTESTNKLSINGSKMKSRVAGLDGNFSSTSSATGSEGSLLAVEMLPSETRNAWKEAYATGLQAPIKEDREDWSQRRSLLD